MDSTTSHNVPVAPAPPAPAPGPAALPGVTSRPATKRLQRSRSDRMIGGVMGGFAQYFGIDSTILRLIYAGVALFSGIIGGVLLYLVAMIVIPEEPLIATEGGAAPPAPPIPPSPSVRSEATVDSPASESNHIATPTESGQSADVDERS